MSRLARLAAAVGLSLGACTTDSEAECLGGGAVDMVVTPSLFNYEPLEDGARVPVYDAAQGGTFTELDIEITGVAEDDLGSLSVTVVLKGGDVIAPPQPSMSFGSECREGSSILIELFPVALSQVDPLQTPDLLDEREAAIIVQMQLKGGNPPLTGEFDVILDERTLN